MLPTLLGQSLQLSPLMSRFEQSGIKLELLCHSFSRTLTAKGNSCGLGFFLPTGIHIIIDVLLKVAQIIQVIFMHIVHVQEMHN